MLLGSHLAGLAFSNAGVTAAHALAYPLGARCHIPHGVSVLLFLPAVLEFNAIGSEERFRELSSLCTGRSPDQCEPTDVIGEIDRLCAELNLPENLATVGVEKALIPEFAQAALGVQRILRNNPREISTIEHTRPLYERAYSYERSSK